jgi:excisionase family DNA binding protein
MAGAPLSVLQAAERLNVSRFTLRRWIRERRVAHYRLGRRVVLAESDIDAFLNANRIDRIGAEREGLRS